MVQSGYFWPVRVPKYLFLVFRFLFVFGRCKGFKHMSQNTDWQTWDIMGQSGEYWVDHDYITMLNMIESYPNGSHFHFEMKTFLLLRLFQKWLILVWMASWLVGLCGHSCHSCSFVFHVNYDALLTRPQFSQVNLLPSASLSSQWHCCHILAIPISPLENPTE